MIYDKADYHHTEGVFPSDLSEHQAFVHTGMYLGWLVDRNLASREFQSDFSTDVAAFRDRKITAPQLYRISGGVLEDSMIAPEGNSFTENYFDFETGKYLNDYLEILAKGLPSLYHVDDTLENYLKIRKRIDERYLEWKQGRE